MTTRFIKHYGYDNQLRKLKEEAIELIEAIDGYLDGSDTQEHLTEEMADCLNLIEQFQEYGNDGEMLKIKLAKRARQDKRIRNEKQETR